MRMSRTMMLVAGASLVACGNQEDPTTAQNETGQVSMATVATRTSLIVGDVVEEAATTLRTLIELQTWQNFGQALDNLGAMFGPDAGSPTPSDPPMPPPNIGEGPDLVDDPLDPEAIADEVRAWLEEEILTDDNLESIQGNTAIFLLGGDDVCPAYAVCSSGCATDDPWCDTPFVDCTEEIDADCVAFVDALELRISATVIDPDGVEISVLIGPDRVAPWQVVLIPDQIISEVDLGAARDALEHALEVASQMSDEPGEMPTLPQELSGRLRGSLTVNGELRLSLDAAIIEAVHLVWDGELGNVLLDVAAADPLYTIDVDGLLGLLSLAYDLNSVDLSLPYALLTGNDIDTGDVAFHLGGFSFAVDLDDQAESLAITNIGFGDTTTSVSKDGFDLFTLDLNAASGRRFDLTLEPTTDSVILTCAPSFELELGFGLAAIADDVDGEIPSFFLDETWSIALAGNGSASVAPVSSGSGVDGGLEVVTGSLALSSTTGDAALIVPEGQCLVVRDATDPRPDESHELLRYLDVAACP